MRRADFERIKNDPEKVRKYREKARKDAKALYERRKNDPDFKARAAQNSRAAWERIKSDPDKMEAYRALQRKRYAENKIRHFLRDREKGLI